jgi:hypothetical protein
MRLYDLEDSAQKSVLKGSKTPDDEPERPTRGKKSGDLASKFADFS